MALNIGLNVVEVDGSASPAIVGAATSVGAFNILTQRGVANRPARITNFTQFVSQFGGYFDNGLGPYLVRGFFDNGGQVIYINRVVALGSDADPTARASEASLMLQDGANRDTLKLEGGSRGLPDPGAWANDLYVAVTPNRETSTRIAEVATATLQGNVLGAQVDMSALPSLSVRIDGAATPTVIPFRQQDFANPAQATAAEIRAAINKRTTDLVAALSADNRLVLTSSGAIARLRKDWSSLEVTAANAPLGLAVSANPVRGTPANRAPTGTRLDNAQVFEVGDVVELSDGARKAAVKIRRITPLTNEVEWAPAVATIATFDPLLTTVSALQFDITVAAGGITDDHVVEQLTGLSMEPELPNYAQRRINDPVQGSRYVLATDQRSSPDPGANTPQTLDFTRLNPGSDGTAAERDFIGDQSKRTGFYAFDPYDVQLVCCERTAPSIVQAALTYCASRGDCMFIGSVPEQASAPEQAVAYGQSFQGKKVYGALYGPWIKVSDPVGVGANPVKWVPPAGHVAGVYARIETTRGIWKAPAGDEASIAGALDVEYRLSDAEHTDLVKNGSVNGIRAIPRAGIVIDASRTLSTDTRWLYVNVRLLFNYVKSSLKGGLRWVKQEPNTATLWNAAKFTTVMPFLTGLWRQGAFGTGTPEQVFTVICDATNNPPDQVDQGNFKLEVYFYPSKPAETILIVVGQQQSGARASDS